MTPFQRLRWIGRRHPQLIVGTLIVVLFVVVGLGAPFLAPYPYDEQNLSAQLRPPIWAGGDTEHLLGTDELGRDVLTRLLYGARVSLIVGFFSVVVAGIIGVALGLISGYVGGNVDAFLMRIVDIQYSFPYILIAILITAAWDAGVPSVILALSIAGWMAFARTTRGLAMGQRHSEHVLAARSLGASSLRIMVRHVLPNILGPLIVFATFQVPGRILAEATLSFVGLGVQPPVPSWGNMLAQNRGYLVTQPWLVILPGLALSIVALGVNQFGDGIRDLLDPKMRRRQ